MVANGWLEEPALMSLPSSATHSSMAGADEARIHEYTKTAQASVREVNDFATRLMEYSPMEFLL